VKLDRVPVKTPTINLSPLIDVVFILLIFVVLVAKFMDQERLDVTLPSAAAGRPAEVDALMIELSSDGVIALQGRVVSREELEDALDENRARYGRAVLVADREVELQQAVDIISMAKLAGFKAVAVATRAPQP
jgi:biopolymer transport protein ExbD